MYFSVAADSEKLRWKMLQSLPTIKMVQDNDEESEWGEIEGSVSNLSMALSLAIYEQQYY